MPDNKVMPTRPADQPTSHNTVLVSIIIPAYNTANYIHKAIESSQRQTHSNVEIIIIDDGSTDDTLKISQAYSEKDSRVKVIHQNNAGVSSARNHGMREANGEYYVFLDSDDWLEDDAVEVLLDTQIKHPDKLIAANYYRVKTDDSKQPVDNENVKSRSLSIEEVAESYAGIQEKDSITIGLRNPFAKIFRADICREGVRFIDGIPVGEDTIFVFDYINIIGGAFYINKPVLNYLERPDSATRAKDSKRIRMKLHSLIRIHEIMMNHPKNTPEVKKLIGISGYRCIIGSITSKKFTLSDKEATRKYLKNCAGYILTCRKISLTRKLLFICRTYFPFCVSRAIFILLIVPKKIRDKIMRK